MKTIRLPILLLLALAASRIATAAETTNTTLAFSDPSRPGTLNVYIANGELTIRATDSKEIRVTSSTQPAETSQRRPDGLRVLTTAATFSFTEKDNVASLEYGRDSWPMSGGEAEFEVEVPRDTALRVQNGWGGGIAITGVTGDVEVKNLNGGIELTDLGGAALVETMNGEITASFVRLVPGKPVAFTSMNGEIRVNVPVDARATVRMRTQNGAILTNFDEQALRTKPASSDDGPEGEDAMAAPEAAAVRDAKRAAVEAAREATREAARVAHEATAAAHEAARAATAGVPAQAPRAPRAPRPPRLPSIPAIGGGKVVSGELNGGGTDVQLTTMNGDIILRHSASAP